MISVAVLYLAVAILPIVFVASTLVAKAQNAPVRVPTSSPFIEVGPNAMGLSNVEWPIANRRSPSGVSLPLLIMSICVALFFAIVIEMELAPVLQSGADAVSSAIPAPPLTEWGIRSVTAGVLVIAVAILGALRVTVRSHIVYPFVFVTVSFIAFAAALDLLVQSNDFDGIDPAHLHYTYTGLHTLLLFFGASFGFARAPILISIVVMTLWVSLFPIKYLLMNVAVTITAVSFDSISIISFFIVFVIPTLCLSVSFFSFLIVFQERN